MKILRLSFNNLASLAGTHHIQFDDNPLAHAGLIAITGKTGAGKSTLLDAMCLALYNEVPRLKGAAGSLKDAGGQEISIKDSKNILRRGTTSGFAELEFIALDGKRYQARWDIRRARNKVDGNLKVERAITCLDDQRVLNQKISEATPIIEKLIGLSFEQFTRAVLLAQSEVGAFLKAKDNERADLLEYLTNSQIFSLVSMKAAEKNSQIKQQRVELENLIGHIETLSQDEIEHLNQQQKELSLQLQNLQQSEKILDNEKKWHLDRNRIYAEMQGKKEIYDVQLDAVNQSAQQQQLLEQLDQFQSIREQFVQRNQLEPQKIDLEKQHADFNIQFKSLKHHLSIEVSKFDELKQQHIQFQQQLESIQPQLEQGLKLDHEINSISEQYKKQNAELIQFHATHIAPLQQQASNQENSLKAIEAQVVQAQQQLIHTQFLASFDLEPQSVLQRLQDYAKQYSALKDRILKQNNLIHLRNDKNTSDDFDVNGLTQQIKDYSQHIMQWSEQHQSIEHLEQQLKTIQFNHQDLQKQQFQFAALQQQLTQLSHDVLDAQNLASDLNIQQEKFKSEQVNAEQLQLKLSSEQQAYQQLEHVLSQQRLLHTQSVQELRAQLKENEACMVCGSHDHPYAQNHTLLEQGLHQLQEQQLNQARIALEHSQFQLQSKRVEISKLETMIEQLQQSFKKLSQQNSELFETCILSLQNFHIEIESLPMDSISHIEKLITRANQHALWINEQLKSFGQQENEQFAVIQQWRIEVQALQQLKLVQQEYSHLEQLIRPIVESLPPQFQSEQPIRWMTQIQQQLLQRQSLLNEQKRLENERVTQAQLLEKTQYQLQMEQQNHSQLTKNIEQLIQQGKDLRQNLADLTQQYAGQVYRVAAEWRSELDQKSKAWQQKIEVQQQKVSQAESQLNQANLKVQALLSQREQIEQQLGQSLKAIQTWQVNHAHVSNDMIEKWLSINLTEHQQIRRNLNQQQQHLDNAKTAWQLLEEQYQVHLKQQPSHDFDEIETKIIELSTEKSTLQNIYNEIAAKLHLNVNNQATFAKYQTQIEQIKAEEYRWGRIYDLIGHKEGTKFQKIAQEHHLDILVEYANQQLQPLSPRYQLHRIPDSLSLAIIDLDMNSEIRPVLSLSGGETFLVSLALALAIANMASGSMKLESLFIDEGFGTLDPASLHMVMNALDHLQSQGRKVVLISHVQEMHERIPVQIQVKPVGAGASTIEIVG